MNNFNCKLEFIVEYSKKSEDETIKLTGNISYLGLFNPINSIELTNNNNIWTTNQDIIVSKNNTFEYKYIIYNNKTKEINFEVLPNNINRILKVFDQDRIIITNKVNNLDNIDDNTTIINPNSYNNNIIDNKNNTTNLINFNNSNKKTNYPDKPILLSNLDYESNQFSAYNINESFF